jgi:hypothetical protein
MAAIEALTGIKVKEEKAERERAKLKRTVKKTIQNLVRRNGLGRPRPRPEISRKKRCVAKDYGLCTSRMIVANKAKSDAEDEDTDNGGRASVTAALAFICTKTIFRCNIKVTI